MNLIRIREQDPLKQGLKPISFPSSLEVDAIREQDPLKQGLKLSTLSPSAYVLFSIREQDPLKQGLKPKLI